MARGRVDARSAIRAVRRMRRNMNQAEIDMCNDFNDILDYEAQRLTSYMKLRAPWHDNTGAARSGLYCVVTDHVIPGAGQQEAGLVLGHGVDYGLWLEVRRSFHGRYAIVIPTLRDQTQNIMDMLERAWR